MAPARCRAAFSWIVIVILAVELASAAYWSRPIYDDSQISFLIDERLDMIRAGNADRPWVGAAFQLAANTGYFWEIGAAANFLATLLTAAAVRTLWCRLFPSKQILWPVASVLALSTVVLELQATLTPVYQLQVAMACWAATAIWPRSGDPPGLARVTAVVALIAVVGGISEYSISTCLALAGLMLIRTWNQASPLRRRGVCASLFVLAGALAGYGVFRAFSDAEFRAGVLPADGIAYLRERGWTIPFKLANALQSTFGGALCGEFARFDVYSKVGLVSFVAAVPLTCLLAAGLRRRRDAEAAAETLETSPAVTLTQFAASISLGLLPLLAMGRTPSDEGALSRYFVGVLPISACATLFLVSSLVRRRFQTCAALGVAFIAVFSSFADGGRWLRSSRTLQEAGEVIRPLLAADLTLVFADFSGTAYEPFTPAYYDVELTAKLTRNWSREDRRRVWVLPLSYLERLGESNMSQRIVSSPQQSGGKWTFKIHLRGLERNAEVGRVLILTYPVRELPRVFDITEGRVIRDDARSVADPR